MEKIQIDETPKTPGINFDASLGLIEIKGRSIPEDPNLFYDQLINWVSQYAKKPCQKTVVNLNLEYFNTSSSKRILELLKNLEPVNISTNDIIINWYYESDDDDMLEAGETYESMLKIPFRKIAVDM